MKKSILLALGLVLLALTLVGCAAGNAAMLGATQTPMTTNTPEQPAVTPMNTIAPAMTATPTDNAPMSGAAGGMNAAPMGGMMTPADAGKLAQKVTDAVERISEIDDAEVIVRDQRALVAVEFNDQYSMGLDDRMKELITKTVQQVDSSLTEVSITDDSTLYGQVKSLAERIGTATGFDELADDIGDLWDRVTGR